MPRTTTAGMYLSFAVEETAGVRPTTGYEIFPEVKSMPDMNQAPSSVDSTTLAAIKYVTKEPALIDVGDSFDYEANMCDELEEFVEKVIEKQEEAEAAGKAVWFCEHHRKIKKASFYTGKIAAVNFTDTAVGDMLNTTLHVTPTGEVIRAEKPTFVNDPNAAAGTEAASYSARQTAKKTSEVDV